MKSHFCHHATPTWLVDTAQQNKNWSFNFIAAVQRCQKGQDSWKCRPSSCCLHLHFQTIQRHGHCIRNMTIFTTTKCHFIFKESSVHFNSSLNDFEHSLSTLVMHAPPWCAHHLTSQIDYWNHCNMISQPFSNFCGNIFTPVVVRTRMQHLNTAQKKSLDCWISSPCSNCGAGIRNLL